MPKEDIRRKSINECTDNDFEPKPKNDFRKNKLAALTGAGMKVLLFFLSVIVLILVVVVLAVQLLVFLLPLLFMVMVVWLFFRYVNGLKKTKKSKSYRM